MGNIYANFGFSMQFLVFKLPVYGVDGRTCGRARLITRPISAAA